MNRCTERLIGILVPTNSVLIGREKKRMKSPLSAEEVIRQCPYWAV